MSFVSFSWKVSDGSVIMLENPPGFDPINNDPSTWTMYCSHDGSVIAGYYELDRSADDIICRWDNGALTVLTSSTIAPADLVDTYPIAVSANGSVIVAEGGWNGYQLVVWTTPTNGTYLTPLPGHDGTRTYFDYYGRMMSNDGSVIVGVSTTSTSPYTQTNTVWVNGVPSSLGVVNPGSTGALQIAVHCSADGSTITSARTYPLSAPGFWRSGTFHQLNGNIFPGYYVGYPYGCSDDGTRIWGAAYDAYGVMRQAYWDNLTAVHGSHDFGFGTLPLYGDLHILPATNAGASIENFAPLANAAAGSAYNRIEHAVRWIGDTFVNLQPNIVPPGGWFIGRGMDCSGDGTIIGGEAAFGYRNGNTTSAYWDAAGVLHELLPPPAWRSPWWLYGNGYAEGVSMDGSTIHGSGDIDFEFALGAFWEFVGVPTGAVGDAWSDPSYVDFDNATVRAGFIRSDNGWLTLGDNGELPMGVSPLSFLTSQWSDDPWSFTYAYGQDGAQDSWNILWDGVDPATGLPYPDPAFDDCGVPIIIEPPPGVPGGLACGTVTRDFITPTWGAVEGAVSYTLRWRPVGTPDWFYRTGLTNTHLQLGYLDPSTSIEWQVAAVFP